MDAFLLSKGSKYLLRNVPVAGKITKLSPDRTRIPPQAATVPCAACQNLRNAVPQSFHPAKFVPLKKRLTMSCLQELPAIALNAIPAAEAGSETAADKKSLKTSNVTRRQGLARLAALALMSALADVSGHSVARADTPYSQTQGKQTVVGLLKG